MSDAGGETGELPSENAANEGPGDGGVGSAHRGGLRTENSARPKKLRLHWDEENLRSNELEIERNPPRMRIDEPKTPYHPASEAGSSTSGSAPQSPGSPTWIDRDKLVGFRAAERDFKDKASDGSAGSGRGSKSVHIVEGSLRSRGSSGEFERKRKLHYQNEFRPRSSFSDSEDDSEGDQVEQSIVSAAEKLSCESGDRGQDSPAKKMKDMNGTDSTGKNKATDGRAKSVHIVEDPRHRSRGSSDEFEKKRSLHYHNEFRPSGKSVHIVEDPQHRSRGSSSEFERKRSLHYHNEFRPSLTHSDASEKTADHPGNGTAEADLDNEAS